MSRLTELPRLPKSAAVPHAYRKLGDRVLVVLRNGRRLLMTEAEYARAELPREPGALAPLDGWRGPSTWIVQLWDGAKALPLDKVKRAVDLAFSTPAPAARLELAGAGAPEAWPGVWLAVEYADRRAEWAKRPRALSARLEGAPPEERLDFLRRRGVAVSRRLRADGAPARVAPADALTVFVGEGARDARGWVDAWASAGASSVRLEPAGRPEPFLRFYAQALDALLALGSMRELWAAAFAGGRRWDLPGYDLLNEAFVAADGAVYTSEAALALDHRGDALKLGDLDGLRYADLAKEEVARACLAAALPETQPMCGQCVYSDRCAVAPSLALAEQRTLWGRTPSSARCAVQMGINDLLTERAEDETRARVLRAWAEDAS